MTTRARLLDAFQAILLERGDRAATLDAVAVEAGVSKGGLIYHFPSRDALIAGFIERAGEWWDNELENALEQGRSVADFFLSPVADSEADIARALLVLPAADLGQEHTNRTLRSLLLRWSERLRAEAAEDPVRAELIRLVGGGLLMDALTGHTLEPELLAAVRARLLDTPDDA